MSTLYSPSIVTDGLVLHVDAANKKSYAGSGTTLTDRSGNGNHGTLENGTGFSSDNGGHLTFDSTNDRVSFSNSDSLNPTDGLTIEAWVNFDADSPDFIFEKGSVNTQWSLFSHGYDIMFRTYYESGGTVNTSVTKSTYITNGQWHHIVGSWDGSNKRIFIDSNLVITASSNGTALKTSSLGAAIGTFGTSSTGYPFGGGIAKVCIYNRGLTSEEVLQNFNATKSRFGL